MYSIPKGLRTPLGPPFNNSLSPQPLKHRFFFRFSSLFGSRECFSALYLQKPNAPTSPPLCSKPVTSLLEKITPEDFEFERMRESALTIFCSDPGCSSSCCSSEPLKVALPERNVVEPFLKLDRERPESADRGILAQQPRVDYAPALWKRF